MATPRGSNLQISLARLLKETRPLRVPPERDIHGMSFFGCCAGKNTLVGGYALGFIPGSGKVKRGIVISCGVWQTYAEHWPFLLGGAGTVNATEISGVEAEGRLRHPQ